MDGWMDNVRVQAIELGMIPRKKRWPSRKEVTVVVLLDVFIALVAAIDDEMGIAVVCAAFAIVGVIYLIVVGCIRPEVK